MRTLYFDAFSGASGDMILGALVDLSGDFAGLSRALARLSRGRFTLRRRRVVSSSLAATKIDVRITAKHDLDERSFREIAAIVRRGGLPPTVRDLALAIFRRLCEAEARAHGVPFDRVHLHEAGALDAIADICGAAWLLHRIAPDRVVVSPLNVGSGTIECRHGTYPVPGPATADLLRGVPVYAEGSPGERVTPTGAAILSTIASEYRLLPPMLPSAVGHGAGDRVFPDRPNVLRAILGEEPAALATSIDAPAAHTHGRLGGGTDDIVVIETTIDDMNPQNYGFLVEKALASGALEIYVTPVLMKKSRPGSQVTVILPPERFEKIARLLFRETTTIGFRYRRESRRELDRAIVKVATRLGAVRVKVSSAGGEVFQVQPEYEDCRRIAQAGDVPLKVVQQEAIAAWLRVSHAGTSPAKRRRTGARVSMGHGAPPSSRTVPRAAARRATRPVAKGRRRR